MTKLKFQFTGEKCIEQEENNEFMKQFFLHIISTCFDEIIKDIAKQTF